MTKEEIMGCIATEAHEACCEPAITPRECVAFIKAKLAGAEHVLIAREQMEAQWREGTDESWRAAGCRLTKSERLKESRTHGRIAIKCRWEIKMFKAVLAQLNEEFSGLKPENPDTLGKTETVASPSNAKAEPRPA